VILVEASRAPVWVGVRVPDDEDAEAMEAGTTLETTLETVERSTAICQLCFAPSEKKWFGLFSGSSSSFGSYGVSRS
jgi:hypothetical protein